MHKNVTKERIEEVVKQVGLEKRIHEKVSTYSLGMRQRLGLAQALLHRPKFLILDEPTNGLIQQASESFVCIYVKSRRRMAYLFCLQSFIIRN